LQVIQRIYKKCRGPCEGHKQSCKDCLGHFGATPAAQYCV
jgi:hypothetical protein